MEPVDIIEQPWNRPIVQLYQGRRIPGHKTPIPIQCHHFVWAHDATLRNAIIDEMFDGSLSKFEHTGNDRRAWEIQKWVARSEWLHGRRQGKPVLWYVSDYKSRGYNEFWLFPNETVATGKGDCEDGAILIASLLRCADIPADRVRLTCGWVSAGPNAPDGGHGYVVYRRESDNMPVILDWCYAVDEAARKVDIETPVEEKLTVHERTEYHGVWFTFNDVGEYGYSSTEIRGRIRRKKHADI